MMATSAAVLKHEAMNLSVKSSSPPTTTSLLTNGTVNREPNATSSSVSSTTDSQHTSPTNSPPISETEEGNCGSRSPVRNTLNT